MKKPDVKFCPECESYMRFVRLPGGTGYWVCSSCSYTEGKPANLPEKTPPPKPGHSPRKLGNERPQRVQSRPRRTSRVEEPPEINFDAVEERLNEILLRATPPLSPPQIQSLIDRDLILEVRGQYRLTPAGLQALHVARSGGEDEGPLNVAEIGFCRLIEHRIRPEDLRVLAERGLITIQHGQPALTPRGEAFRTQLRETYDRKVEQSREYVEKYRRVSKKIY